MATTAADNAQPSSSGVPTLVNPLEKKQSSVEWLQTIELGYITKSKTKTTKKVVTKDPLRSSSASSSSSSPTTVLVVCFGCGKDPSSFNPIRKLSTCSKCHVAAYCSRDCQVIDWKTPGGHKRCCPSYTRVASHIKSVRQFYEQQNQQAKTEKVNEEKEPLDPENVDDQKERAAVQKAAAADGEDIKNSDDKGSVPATKKQSEGNVNQPPSLNEEIQSTIRDELFGRVRFYVCPYAVFKYRQLGRGFLFLQSDRTLLDLSYATPKDGITGRSLVDGDPWSKSQNRSVLLHYLTLGEFDSELCREDFELYHVRPKLQNAIDTYDPEKHLVLLCRFRDGHMAVGIAVLVPDYGICQKLGDDYYSSNDSGALQLNLDDL